MARRIERPHFSFSKGVGFFFFLIIPFLFPSISTSFAENQKSIIDAKQSEPAQPEGQMPPIPGSRFISPEKIFAQGINEGAVAWAMISERKDGQLPSTQRQTPPIKCAKFSLLVHNIGDIPINVMPANIQLILRGGSIIKSFPGEKWFEDFVWLGPWIIELNGEDVSKKNLGSVTIRKADFVVMEVSFEMHPNDTPTSAIQKTDGFRVPVVFMGKSEEILQMKKIKK